MDDKEVINIEDELYTALKDLIGYVEGRFDLFGNNMQERANKHLEIRRKAEKVCVLYEDMNE